MGATGKACCPWRRAVPGGPEAPAPAGWRLGDGSMGGSEGRMAYVGRGAMGSRVGAGAVCGGGMWSWKLCGHEGAEEGGGGDRGSGMGAEAGLSLGGGERGGCS